MYNYKLFSHSSQVEIENYFISLPEHERLMFNYILYLHAKYGFVYPNQTSIANAGSVTRETANRFIKQLSKLGFIFKKYRHMKSSIYSFARVFTNIEFRNRFSYIFSALKKPLLSALISLRITQVNELYLYNTPVDINTLLNYNVENDIHMNMAKRNLANMNKTYNVEERVPQTISTSDNYDTRKAKESKKKEIEMSNEENVNGALKYLDQYAPDIRKLYEMGYISVEGGINMLGYDKALRDLVLPEVKINPYTKSPCAVYMSALNKRNAEMRLSYNYKIVNELINAFNLDKRAPWDLPKSKTYELKKFKANPVKQSLTLGQVKEIIDEYWELQNNYGVKTQAEHPRWGGRMPSYGDIKKLILRLCSEQDQLLLEAYLRDKITSEPELALPQNLNKNQLGQAITKELIRLQPADQNPSSELKFDYVDTTDEEQWEEVYDYST